MQSDILILFNPPLDDEAMTTAKSCLMGVAKSVLVHQKEGQGRSLLVKFDPRETGPSQLLEQVRAAGFEAVMAGG